MNPQVQKTPKFKSLNTLLISLLIFSLLMLAIAGQLTFTVLKYDKIYNGITVNNVNISKLSTDEAIDALKNSLTTNFDEIEITLKAGNKIKKLNLAAIDANYNIKEVINNAYKIGRSGNIFKRLHNIFKTAKNGKNIILPVSYNKQKLDEIIQDLYSETFINVKEAELFIEDGRVAILSGHNGEKIDKTQVLSKLEPVIQNLESTTIEIPVIITPPREVNIEELYNQINKEPVDASFKITNNEVEIIPHQMGRLIDKSQLIEAAAVINKNQDIEKLLPVEFVQPEITTEKLEKMLFRDTLGSMSTSFSTSSENRSENIKIAASKINGKILAPGEVFSFNEIVGPRTAEKGYKEAHVYVGGKIVDDIGGGICQVSSTLYNAALFADLKIVERSNHMFTVGYVPWGRDATVSYGSVDFKFENSTNWPIKINCNISKNKKLSFTIKGTNENPSRSIELVSKNVKTIDFPTKYIEDPNLEKGQEIVEQQGKNGYIVDTYKIIKENGKTVKNVKLHTSVYNPLTREIRKGTKEVPDDTQQTAQSGMQPQKSDTQSEQTNEEIQQLHNQPGQLNGEAHQTSNENNEPEN